MRGIQRFNKDGKGLIGGERFRYRRAREAETGQRGGSSIPTGDGKVLQGFGSRKMGAFASHAACEAVVPENGLAGGEWERQEVTAAKRGAC